MGSLFKIERNEIKMKYAVNVTKKDIFNAKSGSKSVKDFLNVALTATGCFLVENEGVRKGTNEPCDIGYIVTNEGVLGFSSETCIKALEDFSEYLKEAISKKEKVEIMFTEHDGKNGKYYTFSLV